MNIKGNIAAQFLDFEKKNNLFDLQDFKGTYYWDIIRYYVYIKLIWQEEPLPKDKQKKNYLLILKRILNSIFLFFDCSKKQYLFYLASRDKDAHRRSVDRILKPSYDLLKEKKLLLIESFTPNLKGSYFLPQNIYYKLFRKKYFDFTNVLNLLNNFFGETKISNEYLNAVLNHYYSDLSFFKKILKKHKVEKIFMTQNGIQKGLIKAAKELNIKIFEFQHGVVYENHLAYNYPSECLNEKVYLPDTIFSFSPFWFQDVFLPNVKIVPIGNDFLYKSIKINSLTKPKKGILIISTSVFGGRLLNFIKNDAFQKKTQKLPIFFKLHPNQFDEKEYYIESLREFENIEVISNEFSVNDLIGECDTIFTIISTTVYEALQSERRVILLKEFPYGDHKHIFDRKNLHLVDTVEDFISALNTEIVTDKNVTFFAPFDKEAFLNAL